MQEIHIERLRTLYSVMAGMPSRLIKMDVWRKGGRGGLQVPDDQLLRHRCGTAACALGFASAYPEFKAQGLKFTAFEGGSVRFEGESDFVAGQKFFGISSSQSCYLFSPVTRWNRETGFGFLMTEKQVFLSRLRTLLVDLDIIDTKRSKQLEEEERQRDEAEKAAVPA